MVVVLENNTRLERMINMFYLKLLKRSSKISTTGKVRIASNSN
jgi:hypothetical protein